MKRLYEYILNGLKKSGDFYNADLQDTFENYLISLQSSVRELRRSYRTSCVVMDYSKPATQAAYLIAYYPHYAEMTLEILRLLSSELSFPQEAKACFFGAGPCPEVVGLVQFLVERSQKTIRLIANVYDIAFDKWAFTRRITDRYIIPELWQGQGILSSNRLDLCLENSFQSIKSIIESCTLFIFQNCLNEVSKTPVVQKNIEFLLNNAPLESIVVIADLIYDQNLNVVEDLKRKIESRNDFEILQEGSLRVTSSLPIPKTIRTNLLTGEDGLIPRSRINFVFLALRKGEQLSSDFDDIPF